MHILIAPNAFKNSLDALAAANAIRDGFLESRLQCTCECFPVGDGGDGTAALLVHQLHGVQVPVTVSDPLSRQINASFGLIDNGNTAVIEMADTAGLRLLNTIELNPLITSSHGTGEMMKAALDHGVQKIIIGMGGSATVDGGSGILKALGVRFLDSAKHDLKLLPGDLINLAGIDLKYFDRRILACKLVVLCDVKNILLGEKGAAPVFGPQKGATPVAIRHLEACLSNLAALAKAVTGRDMANLLRGGTAGGAAAGLYAFTNADLVNGIDYFLDITSFDTALGMANLLVTGEGSIDEQTLEGKAPFGVARRARQKNIPVIAMAGTIANSPAASLLKVFDQLVPINDTTVDLKTNMQSTAVNLHRAAMRIGNLLADQGH